MNLKMMQKEVHDANYCSLTQQIWRKKFIFASLKTIKQQLIMHKTRNFLPADKMSDLICGNYMLLQMMTRFGLPLGFGDHTVEEVCQTHQVDCATFLAMANFLADGEQHIPEGTSQLSVADMLQYLKRSHHYFLSFQLPAIHQRLKDALDATSEKEAAFLIMKFFDAYSAEVHKHMDYEEKNVFIHVDRLLHGQRNGNYKITQFSRRHDQVEAKLTELKTIIIKYYPSEGDNYLMNAALFDIFTCEQELASHCHIEDYLFVPAVLRLEKEAI
jgi:regulator of cell morphogenesis and NO signaling